MKRKLILASGIELIGEGFGSSKDAIAELVFHTAMGGYQEIISNPVYTNQMMVMTYPLLGNYGINQDDNMSSAGCVAGVIVREYNDKPSNFRSIKTIKEAMEEMGIVGIADIDTRKLTKQWYQEDSQLALITNMETPLEEGLNQIRAYQASKNLLAVVSCKKLWHARTANPLFSIVAIDCGIKNSILQWFNQHGCNVSVIPYNTSVNAILELKPDGLLLSSGPGNPQDAQEVIALVKQLQGKLPILGIGLGHQIIAFANGCSIEKMRTGHHGNYPVKQLGSETIRMTSQSHRYQVIETSFQHSSLEITHRNVFDQSVEGLRIKDLDVIGVQFHPEGAPGPQDTDVLDAWIKRIAERKKGVSYAKEN